MSVSKDTWVLKEGVLKQAQETITAKCITDLYRVTTNEGYVLDASEDQIVSVNYFRNIRSKNYDLGFDTWIPVSRLQKDDTLNLHKERIYWSGDGTFDEGYIIGWLFGDGSFHKNRPNQTTLLFYDDDITIINKITKMFPSVPDVRQRNNGSYYICDSFLVDLCDKFDVSSKKISITLEKASIDFYCGFLSAFIDTDGTILTKERRIVIYQSDLPMLKTIQRMLIRLGIKSKIYPGRPAQTKKHFSEKDSVFKAEYSLYITKDNVRQVNNFISLLVPHKREHLSSICQLSRSHSWKEYFDVSVKDVKSIGRSRVYTVHGSWANGLVVRS